MAKINHSTLAARLVIAYASLSLLTDNVRVIPEGQANRDPIEVNEGLRIANCYYIPDKLNKPIEYK